MFLFLQASLLPSSDDSTPTSFREFLLHVHVIGSDEASSPCTLLHTPLQRWECGPSLAYFLASMIGLYGRQETQVGLIRVLQGD